MPILGSAPRRVGPKKWVTSSGRTLTAAGARHWEARFQAGTTDGRGHVTKPDDLLGFGFKDKKAAQPRAGLYGTTRKKGGSALAPLKTAAKVVYEGSVPGLVEHAVRHPSPRSIAGAFPVAGPAFEAGLEAAEAGKSSAKKVAKGKRPSVAEGLALAAILPVGGRGAKAIKAAAEAEAAARAATPAEQVVKAATGAERKAATAERKALIREERAVRAKAGGRAQQEAGGGTAGHIASKKALAGEMTSANVRFDALSHLDDAQWEQLVRDAQSHPDLQFFEQLNLVDALGKLRANQPPTDSEAALIERAFGKEAADQARGISKLRQVATAAGEVANVPRSIQSSFDVSGVMRQGLVASIHHPVIAGRNIKPMFKQAFSEETYQQTMREIEARPNFDWYQKAGLHLTELGRMAQREESVMSNLAEKIPIMGRFVRGSGRAYTGFLNLMRADIFDRFLESAIAAGRPNTPELRRQIARQVNIWTGRGHLGKLEPAAVPLNTVFFSPRLFASRVETFTSPFYPGLDPYVRKQAAYALSKLVGAGTGVLILAAMAGAKVGLDPTSADFGKIRIGNARYDIWGGHQSLARVVAQIKQGQVTSTTTGKKYKVGDGSITRPGILGRFIRGKFSPSASLVYDWYSGSDYQGQPFSVRKALLSRSYPLLIGDLYKVQTEENNPLQTILSGGLGAFGIGVQAYHPRKPKGRTKPYHDPYESIVGKGGGGYHDPFESALIP